VWAGRLPTGARRAEVAIDDHVYPAKHRSGLWLAAVPWGYREVLGEVRFLAGDGSVLAATPVVATRVPGLRRRRAGR